MHLKLRWSGLQLQSVETGNRPFAGLCADATSARALVLLPCFCHSYFAATVRFHLAPFLKWPEKINVYEYVKKVCFDIPASLHARGTVTKSISYS